MNLKKVNKVFRERFLNLFMINVIFAAVYLLVLVLIRMKIKSNLAALAALTPALQNLAPLLEDSPAALPDLEMALGKLASLNNQTMLLFLLIPVSTIVLWCIFQGVSWALLSDKVQKNLKLFFTRFSLVSAAALTLLFGVGYTTISSMESVFELTASAVILYAFFSFLILYFLFVFYGFAIRNGDVKSTLKRAFRIGAVQSHKLVPLFIPMFMLLIAIIFVFFNIYTNKILGDFSLIGVLPWTFVLFVLLMAIIWYNIFLNVYLEKY